MRNYYLKSIVFLALIFSTTIVYSQLRVEKKTSKSESPDQELIVGNDKDDHGCISSAGYVWSKIKRECIRPFEIGVALNKRQDSLSTSTCYIIIDYELELIELYLTEEEGSILLHRLSDSWVSSSNNYTLTMTSMESIQLYNYNMNIIYHKGDITADFGAYMGDLAEDETIHEYGRLILIEDGPYPQFNIMLDFPERQTKHWFYLNIEAVSADMEDLYNMEGEYVTINYTSDVEDYLYDMHFDGKTIFGEYAPDFDPELETFTGILMDAESVTTSDLPSTIRVVNEAGEEHKFEYYIDDEMVAVNGKEVIVFYSIAYNNKIVDIKSSMVDIDEDEIRHEYGQLTEIQAGPYPQFIITVDFPERREMHGFELNIEAVNIDKNDLYNMEGKYVTINYKKEAEDYLYDMHFDGKTIFSDYAPDFDPELETFTGVLMDAEAVSNIDWPSTIRVVNDSGEEHKFEYHIDDDMVAVNGKEVKVFYSIRYGDNIIDIKSSKY